MAAGRTIDQLAHEFGLPVSTLRMYQHRGLLPPPERRGRVAYYGEDHAARLRLLVALQGRGFSLAAIKELLDGWQEGRTLDDILGLGAAGALWDEEEPMTIEPAELAARFAGDEISPALLARVVDLGLVRPRADGRLDVVSPRFLDIGSRLHALGVTAQDVIDEYEVVQRACDDLAARFTDLFRRRVWSPLRGESAAGEGAAVVPPAERIDEVRSSIEQLGPLALAVVEAALRRSLRSAAQGFLDEQARALAAPAQADEPDPPASSRSGPSRRGGRRGRSVAPTD